MVRKLHLDEGSSKYKKYIGAEAVLVGDYEDFADYLTDRELAEIEEYIDSDCDIISLGGPNKSYAVIRFSDGAKFTLPFEFLEIDEDTLDEDINTRNSIYAIKRKDMGNKYVKQFSDGYEFTSQFDWIEQYTDKRSADEDARKYSKQIQPGYYVVKLI